MKKFIKTEDDGDVLSNHCSISSDVQSDDELVIVDKSSLFMWHPMLQRWQHQRNYIGRFTGKLDRSYFIAAI